MGRKIEKIFGIFAMVVLIVSIILVFKEELKEIFPLGNTEKETPAAVGEQELADRPSNYYYQQLTDDEKVLYRQFLFSLMNGKSNVVLDAARSADFVNRVMDAIQMENPEYFWLQGCSYRSSLPAHTKVSLGEYDFWKYSLNREKMEMRLDEAVEEIVRKADIYETDYEKAIFVHDYLVKNTDYAFEEREESKKTQHDAKYDTIYTAFGCLVEGRAVCAGYAKAYQLVLNRLGIDCVEIVGETSGELHAWNLVTLDGDGYFVDVTWDDPYASTDDNERFSPLYQYEYCFITTEELEKDHLPNQDKFLIEEMTATKYNYFTYNGYRLYGDFSLSKAQNILLPQKDNVAQYIKFDSTNSFQEGVANLSSLTSFTKANYHMCEENKELIAFYVGK